MAAKPPAIPPPPEDPPAVGLPPASPPPVVPGIVIHAGDPEPEPEPSPSWWQRLRLPYNAACALIGLPLTFWWSHALRDCAETTGLAGAWVLALVPLGVVAFADNVFTIAAGGADPRLWLPKLRAGLGRVLLWVTVLAPATALPLATAVYLLTGVRP